MAPQISCLRRASVALLVVGGLANRAVNNQQSIAVDGTQCDHSKDEVSSLAELAGVGDGVLGTTDGGTFEEFAKEFAGGAKRLDLDVVKEATQTQRLKMIEEGSIDQTHVLELAVVKALSEPEVCQLVEKVKMSPKYVSMLVAGSALVTEPCLTSPYVLEQLKDESVRGKANDFAKKAGEQVGREKVLRITLSKWAPAGVLTDETIMHLLTTQNPFRCHSPVATRTVGTGRNARVEPDPEEDTTEVCAMLLQSLSNEDDIIKAGLSNAEGGVRIHPSVLGRLAEGGKAKKILRLFGKLEEHGKPYVPPAVVDSAEGYSDSAIIEAVSSEKYEVPREGVKKLIIKGYLDSELCSYAQGSGKFKLTPEEFTAIIGDMTQEPEFLTGKRLGPSSCLKQLNELKSELAPSRSLAAWCAQGVVQKNDLLALAAGEGCTLGARTLADADSVPNGYCKIEGSDDEVKVKAAFDACAGKMEEWEGSDILDLHFGRAGRAVTRSGVKPALFSRENLLAMQGKYKEAEQIELTLTKAVDKNTFKRELVDKDDSAPTARFLWALGLFEVSEIISDAGRVHAWEDDAASREPISNMIEKWCGPWRMSGEFLSALDVNQAVPSMCSVEHLTRAFNRFSSSMDTTRGKVKDEVVSKLVYGLRLYLGGLGDAKGDLPNRKRGCAWMWGAEQGMTTEFKLMSGGNVKKLSTRCYCRSATNKGPPVGSCAEARKKEEKCEKKPKGDYNGDSIEGLYPSYTEALVPKYEQAAQNNAVFSSLGKTLFFYHCD